MSGRRVTLRALIVLAAAILALALVADLNSPNSILRSTWHRIRGTPETLPEKILHDVQKARGTPQAP